MFSDDIALSEAVSRSIVLKMPEIADDNIIKGVIGILNHVVKDCANCTGYTQSNLFTDDEGYLEGVYDIRVSRFTAHAFMGLIGHFKGFPDQFFILS